MITQTRIPVYTVLGGVVVQITTTTSDSNEDAHTHTHRVNNKCQTCLHSETCAGIILGTRHHRSYDLLSEKSIGHFKKQ